MNNLWKWSEVCQAVAAQPGEGPDISGISIDSRTLVPGDLFIALSGNPGDRFNTSHESELDGHNYVKQALDAGAAGVLVHNPELQDIAKLKTILVKDTLDALWDLARASRKRMFCPVFAITGSSGKTTLRNFLGACLGIEVVPGSLNNFWGLPLSMARTPRNSEAAIFELGTNSPGEIAPLAKLVQPNIATVLNVFPAHIEHFDNLNAIREEKLSIATGLVADGCLIVPANMVEHAGKKHRVLSFGTQVNADIRLLEYDANEESTRLYTGSEEWKVAVPGGGEHRALTVAATLACIVAADKSPELLSKLEHLQTPAGRGNSSFAGGVKIIDDSYNANPASMTGALRALVKTREGRYFAILGDMLELGEDAEHYHAQLLNDCTGYTGVYCVGKHMRVLYQLLPTGQKWGYAEAVSEIDLSVLTSILRKGDNVLIKGSNRTFWIHDFVNQLSVVLEKTV